MEYKQLGKVGQARVGELLTPHGTIKTPVFMPVGTQGSVKAVGPDDLAELGTQIILGNTYHLYLRPGEKVVAELGGLHKFSGWKGPMLTDSGGFQVSSLGSFRTEAKDFGKNKLKKTKIDEDGVTFWSHVDGSEHRFRPEKAIEIQEDLGADIIMAFDEATPEGRREYTKEAMERTHRWLVRSKARWQEMEADKESGANQALFGIVQGGEYEDLRKESIEFVLSQDLPGLAIGGGTIGVGWRQTEEQIKWVREYFPSDKPVYFMGVGVGPEDAIAAALTGADMFDCVAPTRLARTGILYQGRVGRVGDAINGKYTTEFPFEPKLRFASEFPRGRMNIGNAAYARDAKVVDEDCDCMTCNGGFSRGYLRHLFKSKELLYYRLASIHNLRVMIRVVEETRRLVVESI